MEMKIAVILGLAIASGLLVLYFWRRRISRRTSVVLDAPVVSREVSPISAVAGMDARLVSPKGMEMVCSVGDSDDRTTISTDVFAVVERSNVHCAYACGHTAATWYVIDTYGWRTNRIEGHRLCPECQLANLKKVSCRCGVCGQIILPGDGVALYQSDPGLRLDIATLVDDAVIGCLRMKCCPSGGFMAGSWSEEGFKPMFDGLTAAEKAAGG